MVAGLIVLLKGAKLMDFKNRATPNFETKHFSIVFVLKPFQINIVSNIFMIYICLNLKSLNF